MKHLLITIVLLFGGFLPLHAQNADYTPFRNPKYAHLYQVDTIAVDGISYERIVDKRETGPLFLFLCKTAKNIGV